MVIWLSLIVFLQSVPVAAAQDVGTSLPGWFGWLMVVLALLLPLLLLVYLRRNGRL